MTKQPRRAFYPCCGNDIDIPRKLVGPYVDEIIFCDIRRYRYRSPLTSGLPKPIFIVEDVRKTIEDLPPIDLFFYRRDSSSEGGSGVYLLGKRWLKRVLDRFTDHGGLIITDGSNSGSGIFRKMCRPNGLNKLSWDWQIKPILPQPLLEQYGLYSFRVTRVKPGNNYNNLGGGSISNRPQ